MTLALALTVGVLYAVGTYLLLQRTLSRIVIGLALMGHGANVLLLLAAGGPGAPPFIGSDAPAQPFTDPLPQALALTAIVITFGVIAFLLGLALRSYALTGNDMVEDDLEDRRGVDLSDEPTAERRP
jgi:multicomponent Na+:H+ antiporter subunit C